MNKTVIINIAGSIFHIEEEAYDLVKLYDGSIRRHFSEAEDGFEIVSDIENRIAELFSDKLKLTGRQVVELEDVKEVIARLGTVEDFSFNDADYSTAHHEQTHHASTESNMNEGQKRLMRDPRNKMLGGVCSGIASYFNVDTTMIRLLWAFSLIFMGAGVLLYLVLWAVVPQARSLDDFEVLDRRTDAEMLRKKIFRDVDNKAIAGVCSGIAAYFNIDTTWVRLFFVALLLLSGFAGFHYFAGVWTIPVIVIYFILWMVIPEAKTASDKRAMKGEPDTLDDIIKNAEKKNKDYRNEYPQSPNIGHRLLSFISQLMLFVIRFVGKFAGLFLILFAVTGLVLLILIGGLVLILDSNRLLTHYHLLSNWERYMMALLSFVLFILPASFLFWAGCKLLFGMRNVNKQITMMLAGLWLTAFVVTAYMAVQFGLEFNERATIEESMVLTDTKGVYRLTVDEDQNSDDAALALIRNRPENGKAGRRIAVIKQFRRSLNINEVDVWVEKSPDQKAHLIQRISASGQNSEVAIHNAENIAYNFVQQDSILRFNRHFQLKEKAIWRNQKLELVLQLPINSALVVDDNFRWMSNQFRYWQCDPDNSGTIKWIMTEDGLKCSTPKKPEEAEKSEEDEGTVRTEVQ